MELSRELMGGSLLKLFHGFEDVRFHHNASLGYTAIIAVHSTVLGPSLGGCRRMPYRSLWEAFFDVSRLARGMTYKAALAGLPLGGGKCVMIPRKHSKRLRAQQFRDLGSVVASMGGIYISAEDVGTTVADIDEMATTTSSVCGNMPDHPHHGNPSPFTAEGVLYGMLGALRAQNGPTAVLANRSVYVEGLGKVGFALAELLHREGAVLYVSNRTDTEAERQALVEAKGRFGATVIELGEEGLPRIFPYVEIYAPCALGGTVAERRIYSYPFSLRLIAGCANNVLLDPKNDGERLLRRNILYAPDYAINNGGLRDVHHQLRHKQGGEVYDVNAVFRECRSNEQLLFEITSRALREQRCPHVIADTMAEEVLMQKQRVQHPV